MTAVLIVVAVVVFLFLVLLWSSVKVVREYQRIVLFRFGRMVGLRGPGIVIIIPFIRFSFPRTSAPPQSTNSRRSKSSFLMTMDT